MTAADRARAIAESDALHARVRDVARAWEHDEAIAPGAFDALACDIARFQARHIEGFARLCRARGVDALSLARADDIPAVPTDAFKVARVSAFPEVEAAAVFRTSGTTLGARGTHAMRTTETYDAVALAFGRAAIGHGAARPAAHLPRERAARFARHAVVVVGPSPDEATDSSLTHMFALFARELGASSRGGARADQMYFVRGGELRVDALCARIASLDARVPALVLGTSFAYVHLLDALGERASLALPRASRVVQTGGFKGKSRDVDASALRTALGRVFAVDVGAVVSEYGMTELSSQFYDAQPTPGLFVEPAWARVVPVDPVTLVPVPDGEVGIARIVDLANVDSAVVVLAADRVRRVGCAFELLGRAPGAAPRGCSIAIDEMLGGAAAAEGAR